MRKDAALIEAERELDRATEEHEAMWNTMHRVGVEEGRDSAVYRDLHAEMLVAASRRHRAAVRISDLKRQSMGFGSATPEQRAEWRHKAWGRRSHA